jgi:hypothetical protein
MGGSDGDRRTFREAFDVVLSDTNLAKQKLRPWLKPSYDLLPRLTTAPLDLLIDTARNSHTFVKVTELSITVCDAAVPQV